MFKKVKGFLKLREWRFNDSNDKLLNDAQSRGGLGGVIFEGSPGSGKSELLLGLLVSEGYKELRLGDKFDPSCAKYFYRISAGLSDDKKIAILTEAFMNGYPVLWDEKNSSSSARMERFLNAIAMGRLENGTLPRRKGFFILVTQNSSKMAWRYEDSTASDRRFLKIQVPDYTLSEMKRIVQESVSDPETIDEILIAYKRAQIKGNICFRDLIKMLKNIEHRKTSQVNKAKEEEVLKESARLAENKRRTRNKRLFLGVSTIFVVGVFLGAVGIFSSAGALLVAGLALAAVAAVASFIILLAVRQRKKNHKEPKVEEAPIQDTIDELLDLLSLENGNKPMVITRVGNAEDKKGSRVASDLIKGTDIAKNFK